MTTQDYQSMRFQAACAAMQGMLPNERFFLAIGEVAKEKNTTLSKCSSVFIVEYADALLKELGVEEPK